MCSGGSFSSELCQNALRWEDLSNPGTPRNAMAGTKRCDVVALHISRGYLYMRVCCVFLKRLARLSGHLAEGLHFIEIRSRHTCTPPPTFTGLAANDANSKQSYSKACFEFGEARRKLVAPFPQPQRLVKPQRTRWTLLHAQPRLHGDPAPHGESPSEPQSGLRSCS